MRPLTSFNCCSKWKQPLFIGAVSIRRVYQLGNWKAGKTVGRNALSAFPLRQPDNRMIHPARKSAFHWKERLSGNSKSFLNAQIQHPLEGKIEPLRRDASAAHFRLPTELFFAREQIVETPLAENLTGSVCFPTRSDVSAGNVRIPVEKKHCLYGFVRPVSSSAKTGARTG